jgi:glutamate synthase (NADPH/NADH) small chain
MNSGRKVYQAGAPNGKSVAVVGSGPAGLSCATYLARLGHAVTVFDRKSLPGGLDTYGMAEYKITQAVSVEEAKQVADLGVEFRLNTEIIASAVESGANGETPENETSAEKHVIFGDLIKEFDAVFVGIGLGATNRLNVAGEDSTGVIDALDFIERIKTREWRTVPIAGTVAVIGAGNTAIDAVTQAKRLGAERVLMVYRRTERDISAYKYEYELAKKDGVEFVWQAAPIEVVANENGAVAALRCERTDGSRQIFEIKCEMIVKAIGQRKQVDFLKPLGIETDEKGRVLVDLETMQTSNSKIFAGGDCVNGGREAVDAAQTGKLAAQGIHHALTGERIEFAGARLPFLEKAIVQIHATPVPAAFDEPAIPAEDLGIKSYG